MSKYKICKSEITYTEEYVNKLNQQIDRLTNNWNELERWCKNNLGYYGSDIGVIYKYVLDKMKEIKDK